MGLCQRGSVCASARQIGTRRNVLLFFGGWRDGGGGSGLERTSEEESAPFSEFLSGQPAMVEHVWFGDAVCPAGVFLGLRSCTSSQNRLISFFPSVPLKRTIDRSLSGAPSLLGLVICLCLILPSERQARMRDSCSRFPRRLLMRNRCICGRDNPFHSTNVARDDNNMGPAPGGPARVVRVGRKWRFLWRI